MLFWSGNVAVTWRISSSLCGVKPLPPLTMSWNLVVDQSITFSSRAAGRSAAPAAGPSTVRIAAGWAARSGAASC